MSKKQIVRAELAITIIMCLWMAGTPYVCLYSSKIFKIFKLATFGLSILFLGFAVYKKPKIHSTKFVAMGALIILLWLSMLINLDLDHIGTYLSYTLSLGVGCLLAECFSLENFKKVYTKVMLTIAVVSLFFFALQLIAPGVILDLMWCEVEVNSYNAYVSSLFYSTILSTKLDILLSRNCGIFWEPGVYQAFLNLAILFIVSKDKEEKKDRIQFGILLFTLLTTLSATGIVVMIIICLGYRKRIAHYLPHPLICVLTVIGVMVMFIVTDMADKILVSITGRLDYGILNRLSLSGVTLTEFLRWFFGGRGLSQGVGYNSVINLLDCYGILFTGLIIVGIYHFAKKVSCKQVIFTIAFMLTLVSEPIIMNVIFMWIVFYGFKGEESKKKI